MRRLKKLSKKLALLLFGLFLGVILAEFALWLVGISYVLPYEPDEFCGTRLRPNLSFRYIQEGTASVQTNSHGNRDIERSTKKPDGTIRIAVLGDSYCEALQVERDQAFWAQLESRLNQKCKSENIEKRFEVLNFGVSGYGTAQQLMMLRKYVWKFDPDFVILAFLTGNDIADNSRAIRSGEIKPYFTLSESGAIVEDFSFRDMESYRKAFTSSTRWKVWSINNSRILQVANQLKTGLEKRRSGNQSAQLGELGLDTNIYQKPAVNSWRDAWEVTEALISEINNEARNHSAKLIFVSLSNAIQVEPDQTIREEFIAKTGVKDLFYPDNRLKNHCNSIGVSSLLLAPAMQQVAIKKQVYYHGFPKYTNGNWPLEH